MTAHLIARQRAMTAPLMVTQPWADVQAIEKAAVHNVCGRILKRPGLENEHQMIDSAMGEYWKAHLAD